MKRCLFFLTAIVLVIKGFGQDDKKTGISFSGFVKNDVFFDTRQTEAFREGHFYLYPLNESKNQYGEDINATPGLNILAIQSRLTAKITGPDAFGAKTSGIIEAEFFGTQDANTNGFRLRHAYGLMKWKKTELLFGQTWHALFAPECFPEVVAFNTGAPFQPFSRNPQLRFSFLPGNFKISFSAMAQRDFTSPGGSLSLRNAVIPDLCVALQYHNKPDSPHEILAGMSGGFKILRPRLVSDSNVRVDQSISGFYSQAYFKYRSKNVTLKAHASWGQNMYNLTMLGGYAVRYTDDTALLNRDIRNYTSIDNLSGWIEFYTNGSKFQFGIFAGYTKNLGSLKNIMNWNSTASYFTRGRDISYIYRISPRVVLNSGKIRFGLEPDYTVAAYGSEINSLGDPGKITRVGNIRLLLGMYYFF